MKRPLVVLALAGLLGAAAPLPADEVPHLDFVRALRARHYPDLALEYLDKLRQSNPPADVAAVLPLELAKVHLDQATAEDSGARRLDLYNKARGEFQEFIDKNPNNPLVGEARLEVARVTVLQGKTQLSRALMQEDAAARQKDALVARATFVQANGQIKAVADLLEKQAGAAADPKVKKALEQANLQAQLDVGLNLIDQAQTYLDTKSDVALERAKIIQQAEPIIERAGNAADVNNPIAWQAKAWVGYCRHQIGDSPAAMKKLGEVIDRGEAVAAPGRRLALYFKMDIVLFDPDKAATPAGVDQARKDAEQWLRDYGSFRNTPEGCGVRYCLAYALVYQSRELKDKTAQTQLLNRAHDLTRELTRFENDYGDKARRLSINIIGLQGNFSKDIAKLTSFDDCLVRAEYEVAQIEEVAKKPDVAAADVEKARKERIANAIESLTRGLELADKPGSKVTPADRTKARAMLCGYYLFTGKFKEAITAGEEAARAVPPTTSSARTAMYVLEAYNEFINTSIADGTMSLADLSQGEPGKPSWVERMNDMALMMEQRWPAETAGDVARHMRALLLIKQKKQEEAIEVLAKVSPNYPSLLYVKYQLAMTAYQMSQDRTAQAKAERDKAKQEALTQQAAKFDKQAVETLKALPPLPAGADPLTAGLYLNAKLELARAHYRAKEYGAIDKVIDPVLESIDKKEIRMDQARLDAGRSSLQTLKLFARYGAAQTEFEANHPAKVKEILDPVVAAAAKGEYKEEFQKNADLRWGLMGLVLRVSLQEGNTARALEVLQVAQAFKSEGEGDVGNNVYRMLGMMVKDQIREARKKKDKDTLDKAVQNFTKFLDGLRKGRKAPTDAVKEGEYKEFLRIMAEAYLSLEKYDTATELAREVTEPTGDYAKDDRRQGNYRACRFITVKALRLDGKVKEAAAELDEIRKAPWGKDHPEMIKETNHLMAVNAPAKAYSEWSKLVSALGAKIQQPGMKEQYFERYYYMTECMLRYALALPAGANRDKFLKRAADLLTKLEMAWPDLGGDESKARFSDLLDREPVLKEQYEKAGGGKLTEEKK